MFAAWVYELLCTVGGKMQELPPAGGSCLELQNADATPLFTCMLSRVQSTVALNRLCKTSLTILIFTSPTLVST